ncbi:MAG: PilC/PilY family type IV pilus protein [Pseudomonadota bacterium]
MKSGFFARAFALFALLLSVTAPKAEDVDLFAWANKNATGSANVLLVLDNGANFSANVTTMRCNISAAGVVKTDGTGNAADFTNLDKTSGAVEQCALYSVIKSLVTTSSVTLNIGVMGFNANGLKTFDPSSGTGSYSSFCEGGTGGCLLMKMSGFNSTVQTNMLSWIRSWMTSGNGDANIKGNNAASGATMQESWAYYQGKTGVSGKSYSGSQPTGGCGNNYIIFVGNAYRNNATPGDGTNAASSPLKPLSGNADSSNKNANPVATTAEKAVINGTIATSCGTSTLQTDEGKGIYALNWARYMKNNGVAKTYAIGILGDTCNAEYAAHLTMLGSTGVGGGKYYATNNYDQLVDAFKEALTEILSVNSVFSAVSLPASQNTQGEYLNQIFIGMFRPDGDFAPRWPGNLKQYQLGYRNGVLQTLDSDGKAAVNTNTGFITECARSFWTPATADSYWTNDPKGTCTTVTDSKYSNYPDGNIVEKGGQGYNLRSITPSTRTVKTCASGLGSCNSAGIVTFDTSAVSNTQLGVSTDAARTTLVSWAKGQNVNNSNGIPELGMATTVMRASAHGDVVHSRPTAVNHGSNDSSDVQVVVYYGANDGMLHAVNGNQTASITSNSNTYTPGQELWSFMPPEFYGNIKRLYENDPAITFPNSTVASATAKPYGIDGVLTSLKTTVSSASKTYIYATMRRGGRAVYAFDVTTPGNPALLWKSGCASASLTDSDCTSSMSDMGQSWAPVKTFYASNYGSGSTPLIIMGGGYDTCEDYDARSTTGANHNCTSSSKGKKVYILNALTGAVVRSFDTVAPSGGVARGVVAEAAIVNSDGKAQYAYIPDLGGMLYRLTFTGSSSSDWSMTRIAALGCSTAANCTANRKFMWQPSVVTTDNTTYNILLGSGDREKPVDYYTASGNIANYFFMVKDKPSDNNWLSGEASNCSQNVICLASLQGPISTTVPSDSDLDAKKGWYLALATGEQVVTLAATYGGQTYFSTHKPASTTTNSCSTNLGDAKAYCVKYNNSQGCFSASASDSTGRTSILSAGGLAASPVIVNVTVSNHDYATNSGSGTTTVPVCIGCALGSDQVSSSQQGQQLTGSSDNTRHKSRLYWYLEK